MRALFYRSGMLADAAAGVFATEDQASLADAAVMGSSITIIALYIPIGVVFIAWQYRHAKNARLLSSAGGLGPGWAIAGWFIPIANLVLPAIQLHHSSRVRRVPAKPVKPERSALPIIVLWAIALFAGNALATSALRTWPETLETTADLEAAASSDAVDGYSSLVLVAALLCIAMVRTLTRRQGRAFDGWQTELYEQAMARPEVQHGYPPPPPAMPPPSAHAHPWRRISRIGPTTPGGYRRIAPSLGRLRFGSARKPRCETWAARPSRWS